MTAQRNKRLPTDFFDRLLSNQTDDQINELLTSLVDEQISPVPEAAAEPPRRAAHDSFEDAVLSRDDELAEEPLTGTPVSPLEELIPPSPKMQSAGLAVETPSAYTEPPAKEELSADLSGASAGEGISAHERAMLDRLLGDEVLLEPSPSESLEDSQALPLPPVLAPRHSAKVPAGMPKHSDFVRFRQQARWERPPRKPKKPRLAAYTPPITFPAYQPDRWETVMGGRAQAKTSRRLAGMSRAALWFILPAFIGFSLFSWYPMLKGLWISLFAYHGAQPPMFVGLDNYARAFQDSMFWRTLGHAAGFCALVLASGFWLPLMLAIFLRELRWGRGMLQFLFFLPFLMPAVPAAILWKWILDQGYGLLNGALAWLGAANPHIGWLTTPGLALGSLAALHIWKNTGWALLIYSAALVHIDENLYEEAEIDGATLWGKLWGVTMPGMRNVIGVMLIMAIINTLQLFTEVYILTQGGPMNTTEMIATYIYKQAFFYMDMGYAAALSMLLMLMLLAITAFRLRRLESEKE